MDGGRPRRAPFVAGTAAVVLAVLALGTLPSPTRVERAGVEVRGARLSVDVRGSGPPLVWGHGLTSSRRREDEMGGLFGWSGLADAGRATVVRYDARGHGESGATPAADDYRWSSLALDQWALVDALGLEHPVLGGASMGAATALHAAMVRGEDVAGLVLVIPPTAWATRRAQAELYEAGAALVETSGVSAFVEAAASAPVPAPFRDLPEAPRPGPDVAEDVLPTDVGFGSLGCGTWRPVG